MRYALPVLLVLSLAAVAIGLPSTLWNIDFARAANKLELAVDLSGTATEIEYHVHPDQIPGHIHQRMRETFKGISEPFLDGEKEYDAGVLYFELSGKLGEMAVEAMFEEDGELHSKEVQVSVDEVPAAVQKAITSRFANVPPTQIVWEEIWEAGGDAPTEYHVKLPFGGRNWKVVVAPNGYVPTAFLEVPSEIEVPMPVPKPGTR